MSSMTCEYKRSPLKRGRPKRQPGQNNNNTNTTTTTTTATATATATATSSRTIEPLSTPETVVSPLKNPHAHLSPQESSLAVSYGSTDYPLPQSLSPFTSASTPQTTRSDNLSPLQVSQFQTARLSLLAQLSRVEPGLTCSTLLDRCIDLYIQWWFPTTPVIHEASVRNSVPEVARTLEHGFYDPIHSVDGAHRLPSLQVLRAVALLTALSAVVVSILPNNVFSGGDLLGRPFLLTSRAVLGVYQDQDIENPDSSSAVIRFLHSNCLHAHGKIRMSLHVMGESFRLAQDLHLHDEASYTTLMWPESQVRKTIFWQLYIADKSASILNNVPMTINQVCYPAPITTVFGQDKDPELLVRRGENLGLELHGGFYLCFRLWHTASELLLDFNMLWRLEGCSTFDATNLAVEPLRARITASYLDFTGILDCCPEHLDDPPTFIEEASGESVQMFRARAFWIQHANIYITFHSLRLVILNRFYQSGYSALLGISSNPVMLALRKIEIANDAIRVAANVPLWALVANGESCVEKLRQVGVGLLEIMHLALDQQLAFRAKSLLTRLLDIIARLNSRVVEELTVDFPSK